MGRVWEWWGKEGEWHTKFAPAGWCVSYICIWVCVWRGSSSVRDGDGAERVWCTVITLSGMWLSWELLALGTWKNELLFKGKLPSLYRLLASPLNVPHIASAFPFCRPSVHDSILKHIVFFNGFDEYFFLFYCVSKLIGFLYFLFDVTFTGSHSQFSAFQHSLFRHTIWQQKLHTNLIKKNMSSESRLKY